MGPEAKYVRTDVSAATEMIKLLVLRTVMCSLVTIFPEGLVIVL